MKDNYEVTNVNDTSRKDKKNNNEWLWKLPEKLANVLAILMLLYLVGAFTHVLFNCPTLKTIGIMLSIHITLLVVCAVITYWLEEN